MAVPSARELPPLVVRVSRRGLLHRIAPASRFYWVRLLAENGAALISALFLLGVILGALAAPLFAPADPTAIDPLNRLQGPSSLHWFGTDDLGRDVLSRVIYGARVSLLIGVSVTVVAATLGAAIGLSAAYYPWFDTILMRLMDGLMAFPSILLAIAIMASLGAKTINVIIALAVVSTPRIARLVRSSALAIRQELYVECARAIGLPDRLIVTRYILPNSLSPLIVQCTFTVAIAIIAEASLSFVGAGVPPAIPTWGSMLHDGQRLISRAWWLSVFPGTILFLTVLAFNLVGDGLRDALDPRMRERR
jgi:peptide/nickel transport system permease protein